MQKITQGSSAAEYAHAHFAGRIVKRERRGSDRLDVANVENNARCVILAHHGCILFAAGAHRVVAQRRRRMLVPLGKVLGWAPTRRGFHTAREAGWV